MIWKILLFIGLYVVLTILAYLVEMFIVTVLLIRRGVSIDDLTYWLRRYTNMSEDRSDTLVDDAESHIIKTYLEIPLRPWEYYQFVYDWYKWTITEIEMDNHVK